MISLSVVNSRMKDFYDVHRILTTQPINKGTLEESVRETFRNRNTAYSPDHSLFTRDFATDVARLKQWRTFLFRNHLDTALEFSTVMEVITRELYPMWQRLAPTS